MTEVGYIRDLGVALVVAVAVLVAAPGALAAGKPDLIVAKLSEPPATLAPGGELDISEKTKNKGKRAAKPSKTAFFLSLDDQADERDIALGSRAVKKLGPKKASSATTTVTVPLATSTGSHRLLACADDAGRVKERNERNNCRASASALNVVVNPLGIDPVLDAARAATQQISDEGGTLTATGADGTGFSLTIPPGAIANETEITMTPLSSAGGLPFAGGIAGAVELAPDGLVLFEVATLTITPPVPVTAAEFSPFAYSGDGDDFRLATTRPNAVIGDAIELPIVHFSGHGVARGSSSERAAVAARTPNSSQARLAGANAALVSQLRDGEITLAEFGEAAEANLISYYDVRVGPQLDRARNNDLNAERAIGDFYSWARMGELLGFSDGPFGRRLSAGFGLLRDVLENAIGRSYERCRDADDGAQGRRALRLYRHAALLSITPVSPTLEEILECVRSNPVWSTEFTGSYGVETSYSQVNGTRSTEGSATANVSWRYKDPEFYEVPPPSGILPINCDGPGCYDAFNAEGSTQVTIQDSGSGSDSGSTTDCTLSEFEPPNPEVRITIHRDPGESVVKFIARIPFPRNAFANCSRNGTPFEGAFSGFQFCRYRQYEDDVLRGEAPVAAFDEPQAITVPLTSGIPGSTSCSDYASSTVTTSQFYSIRLTP